jgi:hypothetical protein
MSLQEQVPHEEQREPPATSHAHGARAVRFFMLLAPTSKRRTSYYYYRS